MIVESPQSRIDVSPEDLEFWGFDEWKKLYKEDPEQFHRYRKSMLEHQIDLAPESMRRRLKGLVFQMECEAARARTPLLYNMRLSAMLMDTFEELKLQLQKLRTVDADLLLNQIKICPSAQIIPFDKSVRSSGESSG